MSDILAQICAAKATHIARKKEEIPLEEIKIIAEKAGPTRSFKKAILDYKTDNVPALIAEIKKASPSAGVICTEFDPCRIAREYETGGAACLSVLTDSPYFQGKDEYIAQVRDFCPLPVLRKDFMIDPYQIYESRALGADCILLIMAALDDEMAGTLQELAQTLGMDVLVETHNPDEIERASRLGPGIIGINARNLKTMDVAIDRLVEYRGLLPADCVSVAESGITSHEDMQKMAAAGYDACLVGQSLMKNQDRINAVARLLGHSK